MKRNPESMACGRTGLRFGASLLSRLAGVGIVALALGGFSVFAKVNLDTPIVVTQVPTSTQAPLSGWDGKDLARSDWFDGARLVLVAPDGQVRVLSEGFQSACDPNVSFDGLKILFAGRKERNAPWRIWEMGLDGKDLHPITPETMDARSPIYVSTLFTLDSPQPWFTMVFVGREKTINEVGRPSASSLYNIKLEGGELRRLTYNPNNNMDPFQTWDGRLIYSAERYPNEPGLKDGRIGLYAIHMEGADMEAYGGEGGKRLQQMPCATEGGLIVFIESEKPSWDGAGQLSSVTQQRPHVSYKPLSKDSEYSYLYPSPLKGNQVLVSRRDNRKGAAWDVYCFDADTGKCEAVFENSGFHNVQAILAKARKRPDGHSTVVFMQADYGTLYGLNCYTTDALRSGELKQGEVKKVRLIEGIVRKAEAAPAQNRPRDSYVARRLIGEAPVETDGSFNVEAPANTPILLQTLDERGMALGNCGWIWLQPKETRGCIGCHEDPERVPENDFVKALKRPSNRLVPPPEERRSVTFRDNIVPILRTNCATAECHGGTSTSLKLPLTASQPSEQELVSSYDALTAKSGGAAKESVLPAPGKYVDAGRARTSSLVWMIMGGDTSRSWDKWTSQADKMAKKILQMPHPEKGGQLKVEDIQTLILWIDMGAQFEAAKQSDMNDKKGIEAK